MLRWISLFLILFTVNVYANCTVVVGQPTAAAPSCSVDTNEVGDRTDHSSCGGTCHYMIVNTAIFCLPYTADCTGTLSYAYALHYGTSADEGKVCVYSKNSAAPPDSSDLLIGCGTVSSSTNGELVESAAEVGGSVTASAEYWVCIAGSATEFDIIRDDTGSKTAYYKTGFTYATPDANLDGSWNNSNSRDFSMYVTIK